MKKNVLLVCAFLALATYAEAQQNSSKEFWKKRYTVNATCSDVTSAIQDYDKLISQESMSSQDAARVAAVNANSFLYTFIRVGQSPDERTIVKYSNELGSFCQHYPDFKLGEFFRSFTRENEAEKKTILEKMLSEVTVQENPTITRMAKFTAHINSKISKTK